MDNKRQSATFLLLPQWPDYPQHDRLCPPGVINQGKLFLLLSISVSYHSNRKLCVCMCARTHACTSACVYMCVRVLACVHVCARLSVCVCVRWNRISLCGSGGLRPGTISLPLLSKCLRLQMPATVLSGSGIRNFYNCEQTTSLAMWFLIHHFFLIYFYIYKVKIPKLRKLLKKLRFYDHNCIFAV